MTKNALPVLLLTALLGLVTAGCGGGSEGTDESSDTTTPKTTDKDEGGDTARGKELFDSEGCSGCHTLAAADASGTTGPNLDQTEKGKSAAQIEEAIVDPEAEVAKGFSKGIMPSDYKSKLSKGDLDSLVAFIDTSVNK